jgi:CHAD domain-containing protein
VRVGTLDALANRYAGQLPESTFDAIRDRLSQSRRQPQQSDAREVAEQLEAARERVEQWRLNRSGWKAVKRGLRKSYRRGRRAFKRAQDDPTTERLHDWRKRAKDHWYHLRVLEPIAPHTMQGQAEDAHRLSDLLGDDHDLALLREALVADASELRVDVDSVMALVDHRRGQLQAEALLLGRRVYAEKPKAFLRRVRAYWKAWRAQSPTAASEQPAELAELARWPAVT